MSITGTPDGDAGQGRRADRGPGLRALHRDRGDRARCASASRAGRASTSTCRCSSRPCRWPSGRPAVLGHRRGRRAARVGAPAQAPYQAVRHLGRLADARRHHPEDLGRAVRRLGLEELVDDPRFQTLQSPARPAATSCSPVIEERTRQQPDRRAGPAAGGGRRALCADRDYGQVFTDDAPRRARLLLGRAAPRAGPVRQVGSPMRLSRTPPTRAGAGPRARRATLVRCFARPGWHDASIDALVASGASPAR